MNATTRKEWREAALTALVMGAASEVRVAGFLLDCMDALDLVEVQLRDAAARNQWLGDAS